MAKHKPKKKRKTSKNTIPLKKQNNTLKAKNPKNIFEKLVGILSICGVALTIYLTWVHFRQESVAFCTQGSGCDIVQQSQWSVLLGFPLSMWGLGLYILLTWNFFVSLPKVKKWKRMWFLSFTGLIISIYLTLVGWLSLGVFCLWCLSSFAILAIIFTLLTIQKPQNAIDNKSKSNWYIGNALVALAIVAVMFLFGSGIMSQRGDPRLHDLAVYLEEIDAKFYGAYWCPACAEQKRLFSGAANKLPYVECSPNGPNTQMIARCSAVGVSSYPTWIINGNTHVGIIEPEVLANISGFDWDDGEDENHNLN